MRDSAVNKYKVNAREVLLFCLPMSPSAAEQL
jgi:hypothetical protein